MLISSIRLHSKENNPSLRLHFNEYFLEIVLLRLSKKEIPLAKTQISQNIQRSFETRTTFA